MADDHTGLRTEIADALRDFFDGHHAVVQEEDLATALDFCFDGLLDRALVVGADHGLHGLLVRRRCLDGAHVTHAHESEVEGARNRRGAECEHIDEAEEVLEFLLVLHPEALLLINHGEAKVFEAHVLRNDAVRADDNVHGSLGDTLQNFAFAVRRCEAAEHFDGHGKLAHALADVFPVLACQHCGGHKDRHLAPPHDGLESSTNGDLRFAEADVGTQQPVHGFFSLHVAFDLLHTAELVGSFAV